QAYVAQSQYGKAEKAFSEAHQIYSHLGDDLSAANALDGLGQSYGHQLKQRDAELAYTEAHEIYSRVGNDAGAADALIGLGQTYRGLSKHDEAERAFMEAHEIHSRMGNDVGAANALLGLGGTYQGQSRNREAEKALLDAHRIRPGTNEGLHSGNVYRNLGILAQKQYRYNEAEVYYRQALAAYDQADHADSKARTLLALGRLQYSQHKYPDAEETVSESLAIWSSLSNEEGCALSYLFLAQIFKSQSKHEEAKDALTQMEDLLAQIDQGVVLAAILLQLGALCMEQEMYAEAEEHYRVAEAVYSTIENARGEAAALQALGTLYLLQGQAQEAEKCCAQARLVYPAVADQEVGVKTLEEVMKALPLIDKMFDAGWAHFLQLSKSGDPKRASIEAGHIETLSDVKDTEDPKHQDIAREVLNQMSRYRIDPTSIKMADATPHIKGGQGVIMLGTLSLPTTGVEMFSVLKGVETALGLTPEIYEKWGYNPTLHFNRGLSERFAKLEALGIPKEGLSRVFQQSKNSAKVFERTDGGSKEQPSELKVAVKVLAWRQDDLTESAKFFKSFVHEVSLMTKLSHPNIVDLVGFVENMDKGDAWIILQWEENGNVREFLQSGQWDIPERISLIKDTASGLEYLHTQEPPICHGDLKS
ncbi:hypothetical protein FS837_005481, partial [Tulasnella sp. UAMH 9824]